MIQRAACHLALVLSLVFGEAQAAAPVNLPIKQVASSAISNAAGDAVSSLVGRYDWKVADLVACQEVVARDIGAQFSSINTNTLRTITSDLWSGNLMQSGLNAEVLSATTEIVRHIETNSKTTLCVTTALGGGGIPQGCGMEVQSFREVAVGVVLKMPRLVNAITQSIQRYCGVQNVQ